MPVKPDVTLEDLRCVDCAFREGTQANSYLLTKLKAQLCAEIPEEFHCHIRPGLCAGWAMLANKLNAEGYHAAQPEWKWKMKKAMLDALADVEDGKDIDLVAVVMKAMEPHEAHR